jgi:hypothetical protein
MSQIQAYDPNTGEWYDIGEMETATDDGVFLGSGGTLFVQSRRIGYRNKERHSLTPIPAPVWATLGMEALAFVPKERQCDILNFGLEPDGCAKAEFIANDGVRGARDGVPYYPVVWLSPTPAPKKTADELLADIVTLHDNMVTVVDIDDIEKMAAAIKAAKQHLQQNE